MVAVPVPEWCLQPATPGPHGPWDGRAAPQSRQGIHCSRWAYWAGDKLEGQHLQGPSQLFVRGSRSHWVPTTAPPVRSRTESRRAINLPSSHWKPKQTIPAAPQGAGLSPSLLSKPRSRFSCEPLPKPCTSSSASSNHSSHASRAPASHGGSPDAVAWPVTRRPGTGTPAAPGKQTAFHLGLLPCATAATFSRPGSASSTAGKFSKVQPCGCCGLSCRRCCHHGCHRSWRRAGPIQQTNKKHARLGWGCAWEAEIRCSES